MKKEEPLLKKLKNPREPNLSSNQPLQYWLKTFPSLGVSTVFNLPLFLGQIATLLQSLYLCNLPIPFNSHYRVLESITCFSICSYIFYLRLWPPWKCLDKAGHKDISELGRVSGVANPCCLKLPNKKSPFLTHWVKCDSRSLGSVHIHGEEDLTGLV